MPRQGEGRQLGQPLIAGEDEGRDVGRRLEAEVLDGVTVEQSQCPDRRGARERQRNQERCSDEQAPSAG